MTVLHESVPTRQITDLLDRNIQRRLTPAALKAFFRIMNSWKIRDEDAKLLLGGISNGVFYQLKAGAAKTALDQDRLTRISLLTGIFKALNTLYGRKLADAWIGLPNTNAMFGGDTPLRYMIRGGQPAMLRVRQLLDFRRSS